jgi:hypothetical protein
MNTLKELLNKVYLDLQKSDWLKEYPDLSEKRVVADSLEAIALNIISNFIEKDKLEEFVEESEKNYKEETFKRYITNYSEFLDNVEQEFYK